MTENGGGYSLGFDDFSKKFFQSLGFLIIFLWFSPSTVFYLLVFSHPNLSPFLSFLGFLKFRDR
ncbi:unnamed protein product [Meloidogyne enterolobii]|uniref:Uncharacterized protein n=1 Tax=Meloidogyne enterolobii TaxID=390850 RepID=A0ACB0YKM3_MELEN